jgi:hypothetical protein
MATGSLNLTREQLSLITGGDPRAIKAFEDFFAAISLVVVDAAPAVGSLRTLGIGAQQAAAGNDAQTLRRGGAISAFEMAASC